MKVLGWPLLGLSALLFAGVAWLGWNGSLGFAGLLMFLSFGVCFLVGRTLVGAAARQRIDMPAKVAFTVVGCMVLLRHPIEVDGDTLPLYESILTYIDQVDTQTFILWACVAMAVKFAGVITSAYAWHLLLIGQGIRFPFWQKIMTAFLIGRFIGTFMPSTIGLDGYTLYEAGRYSNHWTRVVTAKALEKFIGVTGLFLGMVLTLPFGYQVIVDVTANAGQPEAAPLLAGAIGAVAGGISAVVVVGLVWPVILVKAGDLLTRTVGWFGGILERFMGSVEFLNLLVRVVVGQLDRLTRSVGAYHGRVGLLMAALFCKFVTHFTTAMVYFFTALAIGVVGAKFWPIVFGSTIQILATVLSPTIAGEGAREAFQAILLKNQLGGVAQAVLSGALGFIAAEAATMWGGIFLWVRTPQWRPTFAEVDGTRVDYAWLEGEEDAGFSAERILEIMRENAQPAARIPEHLT